MLKYIIDMYNNMDKNDKILVILISLSILFGIFLLGSLFGMQYQEAKMSLREENKMLKHTINNLDNKINKLVKENKNLNEKYIELSKDMKELKNKSDENDKEQTIENNKPKDNLSINYKEYDYAINPNDHDNSVYYGNSLTKNDIDTIYKYAKKDDKLLVDPHLVIGIMFRDSSFRENVSNGDCHGLGQVNINTANYMNDIYNIKGEVTKEELYNREINIKYMVLYLKYLYKHYEDDKTVLKRYSGSSNDIILERYLNGIDQFTRRIRGVSIYNNLDFKF